jgi:NADH-quinone oxidoreductase subunit I
MLCATACPANCIAIEAAPAPADWPDRDKFPSAFVLDELRCIYCGMCEEACPVDAIELTHIYDMTSETREAMVFTKDKLLDVYDKTKDNPKDPVRTGRGKLGPASEFKELAALMPATSVVRDDRAAKSASPGVIGLPPKETGK